MPASERSSVVTLRLPRELERRIRGAARRRRVSRSTVLREALEAAFGKGPEPEDPAREARRQSLLVSGRTSEREALDFVRSVADGEGWE